MSVKPTYNHLKVQKSYIVFTRKTSIVKQIMFLFMKKDILISSKLNNITILSTCGLTDDYKIWLQ